MGEEYEYAKKLLEQLRNKYSTTTDNKKSEPSTSKAAPAEKKRKPNKTKEASLTSLPKTKSVTKFGNVITIIDRDIPNDYGTGIMDKLRELDVFYKLDGQICPNSVTWVRTVSEGNTEPTTEAIIIIKWRELVAFIKANSLVEHIESLIEILPGKKIFLGVYGMINYFKFWNMQKQGELSKDMEKRLSEYKHSVKITRDEFEMAMTEVQILCGCCYRLLNNEQDVVDLIQQFTKSVIQLPEKLENQDKYKEYDWHMLKDNRDCVQVDKNGNGLQRLWQQQLTTFELARLETAEAVISQYSTPSLLFKKYEDCTYVDGPKLLEDIQVRRAAGPLSSSRKIGPEFSNKLYTFFNSVDGDAVL